MNEIAKCKNCTDEMIEEMAKDIEHCCNWYDKEDRFVGNKCSDCEYWCDTNNLCCSFGNKEATYLYELGYRKIPEGSVVLTSEQYSNYLILQTNHEFIRERAKELQADNERLYKNLGKLKESVRKETAKEFASKVKECKEIKELVEFGYIVSYVDLCKEIDELAKKYGVEE